MGSSLLMGVLPTQYAQSIILSLQSLAVIVDNSQQDATAALEDPVRFVRQIRQGDEPPLKTLQRLDGSIRDNLPSDCLPRAYRQLVTDSFFKNGQSKRKVERYVGTMRQYTAALPHLVQVGSVLAKNPEDVRVPVAVCVHVGETLLQAGLPFPAYDLFEAGILKTHEMAQNTRSSIDVRMFDPIRLMIYVMSSIIHSGFEGDAAAALFLSLTAALQPLPILGKEAMSATLLSTLAGLSLIHSNLVTPAQLKVAKSFFDGRGMPSEPLSPESFREYKDLAIAALHAPGEPAPR